MTVASITIVMPMYQAAAYLDRVLAPLQDAARAGRVVEVIVVDDGSTDDGPRRCREAGFTVLPSGGRHGPAFCRNLGARAAKGATLLFVDSDVVIHDDVPELVERVLAARADVVAVFGAYDDRPAAPGIVSRFRNLLHHYVHVTHRGEASTFWAGCGAVRREAFLAIGGFDARHYTEPSVEDIELGYRLRRAGGTILLVPQIQGAHLKRWTLPGMIRTDVFRRALPWGRLLQQPGNPGAVLNVSNAERLRALIAGAFFLTTALGFAHPPFFGAAAGLLAIAALVSWPFYELVLRAAGPVTAVAAVFLHQLYFVYSALTYVWCVAESKLGLAPAAPGSAPPAGAPHG